MATTTKAKGLPSEPAKPHETSGKGRVTPSSGGAAIGDAGNDRIGRRRICAGVSVQDVRGRSVRHPHWVDGSDPSGAKQGRGLSQVRIALHVRRQRRGRERDRLRDSRCADHVGGLPELPLPFGRRPSLQSSPCSKATASWSRSSHSRSRTLSDLMSWSSNILKSRRSITSSAASACRTRRSKSARGTCTATRTRGPEILRKDDPNKQRVLQLPVYDNDHPERPLLDAGWPERWAAVKKAPAPDAIAGWSADSQGWTADGQARSVPLADRRAPAGPRCIGSVTATSFPKRPTGKRSRPDRSRTCRDPS